MTAEATDWAAWHDAYDDPDSSLSRRLRIVQDEIRRALPARAHKPFRALSLCAGRGDDVIGALRDYPYAHMVRARLIERDARNVRALARAPRATRGSSSRSYQATRPIRVCTPARHPPTSYFSAASWATSPTPTSAPR